MAVLARTYTVALRRFFERRILEHGDVDDLVQEVFLRLVRRGGVQDVARLEPYLFETAANVLRDRLRHRRSRHASEHQEFDGEQAGPTEVTPERQLIGRETVARLATALEKLPQRPRTVFLLRRIEGLRQAEIAARLGVSLSTVEKDLALAVAHVTHQLKDCL